MRSKFSTCAVYEQCGNQKMVLKYIYFLCLFFLFLLFIPYSYAFATYKIAMPYFLIKFCRLDIKHF